MLINEQYKKRFARIKVSVFFIIFMTTMMIGFNNAYAQSVFFIRAGATGANNGSDWTNAYISLPTKLQRGATYYVADGSYGGYNFNTPNSGAAVISIKKATIADHGTGTGWLSEFGDGQAVFTGLLTFTTDYWLFDGVNGGGPGSWESGFGFKVRRTGGGDTKCFSISANHITIRHVDVQNSGESVSGNADNFYVINGNYLTVQYIWTHDTNRTNFLLNGAHHFLLEYSLVSERYSTDGTHGEHMSINNSGSNAETIIRHNIFRNSTNTGTIVIKDSVQSGFKIYGNLFYTTNYSRYYNTNGIIADTTGDTTTDVEIYNNTFLRMQNGGGKPTRVVAFQKSTGNVFFNNIVLGSGGISGVSTRGYNLYDKLELANGEAGGQYFSAEPSVLFRNPSLHDYALRIPTNNGKGLINEEYLTDMLLKTRGKDGVLDRGCFEFDGNLEYDSETIPAPKSLRLQN